MSRWLWPLFLLAGLFMVVNKIVLPVLAGERIEPFWGLWAAMGCILQLIDFAKEQTTGRGG